MEAFPKARAKYMEETKHKENNHAGGGVKGLTKTIGRVTDDVQAGS